MTENDIYYLRSILRQLEAVQAANRDADNGPTLQSEALADDIDWLDCFIEKAEREL